ncbi:hypothetical protein HPB50_025526 [Hyalomma asiaticum]|uniref:Uncharacterized protein n=1 Tax=Hyalomma asiaticum TaxID=266040 RepID=A0ACB7SQY6_HYAAI|nr:hypothetical protein HPB50_025526 [Hyalomma asiaticum]
MPVISAGSTAGEPANETTSSKAESSNATGETESGWRPFCVHCKVVAVVAALLLLLTLTLNVLIPRLNRSRGSLARSGLDYRGWFSVCNNTACHRAVSSLVEPMDLNVSPCDDFYRCDTSVVDGVLEIRSVSAMRLRTTGNFLMGIHRRLARLSSDGGRGGSDVPQIRDGCGRSNRVLAAFYASCLHFGRRPSIPTLQAALSRVGINTEVWLSSKNFQELLARIVTACLRNGLASAISVRQSQDGHSIFVEVGETLKHNLDNGEDDNEIGVAAGRPRWLVEHAIEELQLGVRWTMVAELDGFVDGIRRKLAHGLRSEPFRNIADEQLPRKLSALPWNSILEQDQQNQTSFDSRGVPRNLSFYVRGLIEVGEVLRALGDWTEPDVVNLYTLLVPAAQIFAYIRPWLVRGSDREDRVIPACLRATERRFASEFTSLLAAWTVTKPAWLYFHDMMSVIRRALRIPVTDRNDLAKNGSDAHVAFRVVPIAERNHSEPSCSTGGLYPTFLSKDDYIGNLIFMFGEDRFVSAKQTHAYIAETVKDGTYKRHSSLDISVSGVGRMVFVPPLYLSEDLLHAEASEPSLDVPSVGVPILISWARLIMSAGGDNWSTTAASYGSCVRRNHPLDHALSDRASDEALLTNALLVPWAVRVALTAAATMSGNTYNASGYENEAETVSVIRERVSWLLDEKKKEVLVLVSVLGHLGSDMSASSPRENAAGKSSGTGTTDDGIPKELEEVFDIIEQSKAQMLTWLRDLVAIPSVSTEKEHHKDIMRAISETNTLPDESKAPLPPLLLGTTGQETGKKTLCVYGHLDVFPARKEDGWTSDPFLPTEKDGRLFARGVASDKGPLVAWIGALYAFRKSTAKATPVNLKFLIESMEEVGSLGLDSYLATSANNDFFKGINFVCVAGGFWLSPRTPSFSYGVRGLCSFNVEIAAARSDLESGSYGGTTREAMADLVHLLDSLMGTRGRVAVEGFHDDVAPISEFEWKLYDHVDFDPDECQDKNGIWHVTIDDRVQLLMRRWRYPSLTIHGIEGAHWSSGEKTVIPCRVVGKFSVCTVPNQTCQKVFDCVTRHLERQFVKRNSPNKFKLTMTHSVETWVNAPQRPHTKAAAAAVRHTYGISPDLTREGTAVAAVSHLYRRVCPDVIVLSMTPGGRGHHSKDEYLRVEELVAGL